MRMSIEEQVSSIARDIIGRLSSITLFEKSNKERVQDIFEEMKERGEIFGFLVEPNKRFKDFAVIINNKGKYDMVGVAIKETEEEVRKYMERQSQLRKQISRYRRFIERLVFVVSKETTDENLRKQWREALKQYKES